MTVNVIQEKKTLELVAHVPVRYFPLTQYLKERFIHPNITNSYLEEVHFRYGNGNIQKAVGFKNDAGAFEVRNRNFKGLVGKKKAVTSINTNQANTILVFEGFFDFLAFCTKNRNTKLVQGFIILNSIHGQTEAIEIINKTTPARVIMYLDNDNAGKRAFENIRREINVLNIENNANEYSDFKDYSEYWQSICTYASK